MTRAAFELPRFAVLASGTGSNALALAAAADRGDLPAELACVVTDQPAAPVVTRARAAGIRVVVIDRSAFEHRDAHEQALVATLHEHDVQYVALAGYMRICGPVFLAAYEGRTLNVHPSLLPAYPGRDAIGDALAAGARETGVTVHLVDAGIDTGPIVAQARVAIRPSDDRSTLAARIHAAEHQLFPRTMAALVRGELTSHLEPKELLPT